MADVSIDMLSKAGEGINASPKSSDPGGSHSDDLGLTPFPQTQAFRNTIPGILNNDQGRESTPSRETENGNKSQVTEKNPTGTIRLQEGTQPSNEMDIEVTYFDRACFHHSQPHLDSTSITCSEQPEHSEQVSSPYLSSSIQRTEVTPRTKSTFLSRLPPPTLASIRAQPGSPFPKSPVNKRPKLAKSSKQHKPKATDLRQEYLGKDALLDKKWHRVTVNERATVLYALANLNRISPYPPSEVPQPPLRYLPSSPTLHTLKTTAVMVTATERMEALQRQLAQTVAERDFYHKFFTQRDHPYFQALQTENASLRATNKMLKGQMEHLTGMVSSKVKMLQGQVAHGEEQANHWRIQYQILYSELRKAGISSGASKSSVSRSSPVMESASPQVLPGTATNGAVLDGSVGRKPSLTESTPSPRSSPIVAASRRSTVNPPQTSMPALPDNNINSVATQIAEPALTNNTPTSSVTNPSDLAQAANRARKGPTQDTPMTRDTEGFGMLVPNTTPTLPVITSTLKTGTLPMSQASSLQKKGDRVTLPANFGNPPKPKTAARKTPSKPKPKKPEPPTIPIIHEKPTQETIEARNSMKRKSLAWLNDNTPAGRRQRLDSMATSELLTGQRTVHDVGKATYEQAMKGLEDEPTTSQTRNVAAPTTRDSMIQDGEAVSDDDEALILQEMEDVLFNSGDGNNNPSDAQPADQVTVKPTNPISETCTELTFSTPPENINDQSWLDDAAIAAFLDSSNNTNQQQFNDTGITAENNFNGAHLNYDPVAAQNDIDDLFGEDPTMEAGMNFDQPLATKNMFDDLFSDDAAMEMEMNQPLSEEMLALLGSN